MHLSNYSALGCKLQVYVKIHFPLQISILGCKVCVLPFIQAEHSNLGQSSKWHISIRGLNRLIDCGLQLTQINHYVSGNLQRVSKYGGLLTLVTDSVYRLGQGTVKSGIFKSVFTE